ncbi:MAG: T9SS type A sorting domain-containing protein [Ichthyobacteriaceae bacterium]|nr:T9SS type A sorting domain-containing protein [Ichthyobacteriaceae bacterium]
MAQPIGNNLYFDGDDDIVDAGQDLKLRPDFITIEFWIKASREDLNSYEELIRNRRNGKGYMLTFNNENTDGTGNNAPDTGFGLRMGVGGLEAPGEWSNAIHTNDGYFDGVTWHHMAFTYDGTSLKNYVDGVFHSENNVGIGNPIDYERASGDGEAGGVVTIDDLSGFKVGGGDFIWQGDETNSRIRIDEIRVWNKALNGSELSAMMNYEIEEGSGGNVKLVGTSTEVSTLSYCDDLILYYTFDDDNPDEGGAPRVDDSSCNNFDGSYNGGIDGTNVGDVNCSGVAEWKGNGVDDNYLTETNWKEVNNRNITPNNTNNNVVAVKTTRTDDPQFRGTNEELSYCRVYVKNTSTNLGAHFTSNVTMGGLTAGFMKVYAGANFAVDFDKFANVGYLENKGGIVVTQKGRMELTRTDKIFLNEGTFKIESGEEGTGSLLSRHVIGGHDFEIQRYIEFTASAEDNKDYRWHLVSSPIKNATSNVFYMHYLHSFEEQNNAYSELVPVDIPMGVGQGYAAKMTVYDTGNRDDANRASVNPVLYNGIPNTLFVKQPVTTITDGWNLLGNPFTSPIDLNKFLALNNTRIDNSIYFIIDDGQWGVYPTPDGGDEYKNLPMGQGIYVHATQQKDVFFSVDQQVHDNKDTFHKKETEPAKNMFILKATVKGVEDKAYYVKDNSASFGFVGSEDAFKILAWSDAPNVFFTVNDEQAAISKEPTTESATVGFSCAVDAEQVVLSVDNVEGFDNLILEDKNTGDFVNLTEESYTFDYSKNDDDERFVLHFADNLLSNENENTNNVSISTLNDMIVVNNANFNDVTINVYDIMGSLRISNEYQSLSDYTEIQTQLDKGVYIVILKHANGEIKKKIIIN